MSILRCSLSDLNLGTCVGRRSYVRSQRFPWLQGHLVMSVCSRQHKLLRLWRKMIPNRRQSDQVDELAVEDRVCG